MGKGQDRGREFRGTTYIYMYVVNTVTINGSITFKTCDYVAHLKFIYINYTSKQKQKTTPMGKKKTLNSKKNNSYSEASQNFTREPSEHVKNFKDSSLLPKFQHAHSSNCPRINTIAANGGFLFFYNSQTAFIWSKSGSVYTIPPRRPYNNLNSS